MWKREVASQGEVKCAMPADYGRSFQPVLPIRPGVRCCLFQASDPSKGCQEAVRIRL